MSMYHGNVKWFDLKRGFGFIEPETGKDIPVLSDALQRAGLHTLKEGQLVAFDLNWHHGEARAEDLKIL